LGEVVTSALILGVAGNVATNVITAMAQPIRGSRVGGALVKAGVLRPNFMQALETGIRRALVNFLSEHPEYQVPGVCKFLESKSVARDIGKWITDGRPIDSADLVQRLANYVGLDLSDAPEFWPNNIDPAQLITDFTGSLTTSLASDPDSQVLWLGTKISQQTVTLENVKSRLENISASTAEIISQTSFTSDYQQFEDSYLSHLASRFERLTTPGARELHGVRQALSIAYISLNLKSSSGAEAQRAEKFLAANQHVVIRGPAGSGKTTLLSWIVKKCIEENDGPLSWKGLIPFLVPLRKVARLHQGAPRVEQLVEYSVDNELWTTATPSAWLDDVLVKKPRAVIMIDGVDELPPSRRPEFWDWLANLEDAYPKIRIIVTSRTLPGTIDRTLGDQWSPPKSFLDSELQDMSDGDIAKFIEHWHDAVDQTKLDIQEISGLLTAKATLPVKLTDSANRRIRELCSTPLLCAMVCVLHWREEGYLPRYRVDLYDKCCEMLIEARDMKRGVETSTGPISSMSKNDKEMILQRLAIEMMHNRADGDTSSDDSYRIEISRDKAIAWIKPRIGSFQSSDARLADPEAVLNYLVERTGLLREPAVGLIDFPHRTFQEYLAACAAGADSQEDMLARQADDDQWHETIMLAAGTTTGGVAFGRKLIDALIRRGERHTSRRARQQNIRKTSFALALGCLENLKQQDPDLRERVLGTLSELVPPRSDVDARILSVAGDAAVPHLHYAAWKDENTMTLAACARALRLIGTAEAIKALERGYLTDGRDQVIAEVCRSNEFSYSRIPLISDFVAAHGKLPPYIPEDNIVLFRKLPGLKEVTLSSSETRNAELVSEISGLETVEILAISEQDVIFGSLPKSVRTIGARGDGDFNLKWADRLPNLANLSLVSNGGILAHASQDISSVENLSLCGFLNSSADFLNTFPNLRMLWLDGMQKLGSDLSFASAPNLTSLRITDCFKINDLRFLSDSYCLSDLVVENDGQLLKGIPAIGTLRRLRISGPSGIDSIAPLLGTHLEDLHLASCSDLHDLEPLSSMTSLKNLGLGNLRVPHALSLPSDAEFDSLSLLNMISVDDRTLHGLRNGVRKLTLNRCPNIRELALANPAELNRVSLMNMPALVEISTLKHAVNLNYLYLHECDEISELSYLKDLPIERLTLSWIGSLCDISVLSGLKDLRSITINNCPNVDNLSFLEDLPQLQSVHLYADNQNVSIPESILPKVIRSGAMRPYWTSLATRWWEAPWDAGDNLNPYFIRDSYRMRRERRWYRPSTRMETFA